MPIAIVIDNVAIPAIFKRDLDDLLLADLRGLSGAPELPDIPSARKWLASLPEPSGWYDTMDEAKIAVARIRKPSDMTGAELKEIRESLHMTRAAFGEAIGYKGSDASRNKQIFSMEIGDKPIMPDKARAIRALAAERAMA